MPVSRVMPFALLLAACSGPGAHRPVGRAGIGAWIPADAMAIVVGAPAPGEADALDALAGALKLVAPRKLLAPSERVAAKWDAAKVAFVPVAWIDLSRGDPNGSTASCVEIDDAKAIAALGGTEEHAGGATIVELPDDAVVVRDGIACVVSYGAKSLRERAAVRLATLGDDERAPALAPTAAYTAWGTGAQIGGGIDAATAAALGDARQAVGVGFDVAAQTMTITVNAPDGTAAIGRIGGPPARVPDLPLPGPGEEANPDVPYSKDYDDALAKAQVLFDDAKQRADTVRAIDDAGQAAWIGAWGTAEIRAGVLRWKLPQPIDRLRHAADAAYLEATKDLEAALSAYQDAANTASAAKAGLIKIRAHDVAAWDRAHTGAGTR